MLQVLGRFEKQPEEIKDYDFRIGTWLTAKLDTLLSFTVTATAGIAVDSAVHTDGIIKTFISGGLDGETHVITCTVLTTAGRKEQGEIQLTITEVS